MANISRAGCLGLSTVISAARFGDVRASSHVQKDPRSRNRLGWSDRAGDRSNHRHRLSQVRLRDEFEGRLHTGRGASSLQALGNYVFVLPRGVYVH